MSKLSNLSIGFYLLAITAACNAQVKNNKIDQEKIIGSWILKADTNSHAVFTKTEELNYYQNALMATGKYEIKGDILVRIDKENGQAYTYQIVKLTSDSLILKTIIRGMEPHVLNYSRKKS